MSTQSIRLMRSIIALVAGIAIAISLIAFYYYIIPFLQIKIINYDFKILSIFVFHDYF